LDYFFSKNDSFVFFTIQSVIYSLLLEIIEFDWSVLAKILIFQLVNFYYFLVKNDNSTNKKRTR